MHRRGETRMTDQAQDAPATALSQLLSLMAALRNPDTGCPWDVAQDFASIAPYTIEEAYEVADAIARGDIADLRDELATSCRRWCFTRVSPKKPGISISPPWPRTRLVRRHPHVFGDRGKIGRQNRQLGKFEGRRACRQRRRQGPPGKCFGWRAAAFPALLRAYKLQRRAARVGFDWPELAGGAKVEGMGRTDRRDRQRRRPGPPDRRGWRFAVRGSQSSRHLEIDPEAALRAGNAKFERRFRAVEDGFREKGRQMAAASIEDMGIVERRESI